MTRGVRNLALLGGGIVLFACLTTTISLTLYHNSGDIYLDRSRPGFLPEEKEESKDTKYQFSETGRLNATALQEFIEHYSADVDNLKAYSSPFDPASLSDKSLGLEE